MKAEELRIGNYVRYLGVDTTINVVSNGFISTLKSGAIAVGQADPIPLTEEWLLKFGFEKYDWINGYFIKCNGKHLFIQFYEPDNTHQILVFFTKITQDRRGHLMHGRDYFIPKNSKQYVHQIQNLYFALTGKELKTKSL